MVRRCKKTVRSKQKNKNKNEDMIAFIDTEVNPRTKKVADYGAVREDGAVLHSSSKADFDAFVSKCDTVCGHNIINFDLKYTSLRYTVSISFAFPQTPLSSSGKG